MKDNLIIFDLDGTVRKSKSGNVAPRNKDDVITYRFSLDKIKLLANENVLVAASNQGEVSFGYLSEKDAWEAAHETNKQLGNHFQEILLAFYHPNGNIAHLYNTQAHMRKPDTGMIDYYKEKYKGLYNKIVYIGDGETDKECANNSGIQFIWAHDFFGVSARKTSWGYKYLD
ncbi:HAD-IIIA family hydrolase [Candidatus Uabimicrobium sp. HlEnr_7]|uniref:HAD-IIIA family hydrolase n=1 Tax=Candidatus Uabimicrobium helgolandensis TaxID=3095367 RepID=UPI0035592E17